MRKPFTDEEMEKEVRRAKRFIDISFTVTLLLAAAGVVLFLLWSK